MILRGGCLDVMAGLDPGSVDSVVTDPPYGLAFMGKAWDHGVPGPPFWEAALRVARPGSFMLTFGGTRTWHRLACAIEDSGWEIRDTIMWLYGQGFPKGRRCLKPAFEPIIVAHKPLTVQNECARLAPIVEEAICALKGQTDTSLSGLARTVGLLNTVASLKECLAALSALESKFTTATAFALTTDLRILRSSLSGLMRAITIRGAIPNDGGESVVLDAVATSRNVLVKCARLTSTTAGELAIGMRADEEDGRGAVDQTSGFLPIIVARKAGSGELQIEACRLPIDDADRIVIDSRSGGQSTVGDWQGPKLARAIGQRFQSHQSGRWPANLCLDEEAAAMLDEEVGESVHRAGHARPHTPGGTFTGGIFGSIGIGQKGFRHGDSGGPSRFFYCAKASRSEREAGLQGLRATVGTAYSNGNGLARGGNTPRQTPHQHSPTTNPHPTVKPLALMRWLTRLVTPPGGTVLDPFAGSGTTGCAAALEGLGFIGIEKEAEYARIAEARIAYWGAQPPLPMEAAGAL